VEVTPRVTDSRYAAAGAWGAAAALWSLIWFHGTMTHGFTEVNEMRLWLGLTWMDSEKFLAFPFGAVLLGLFLLGRQARFRSRWTTAVWVALLVVVAVQTVTVSLQFWPFPWGSYRLTFEDILRDHENYPALVEASGPIQAVASLIATLLLIPLGVALARAKAVAGWAVPAVVIGMLFTFFPTPASWVPAVGWLLMAVGVARTRSTSAGRGS
jgi:hypothetical protein